MSELRPPDLKAAGDAMYAFVAELYPLDRSITGQGLRATLAAIAARIPIAVREVPTGTAVLDWTIPREWNCAAASIRGPSGRRIADFEQLNLHVVNYSQPIRRKMSREELDAHLHSLPDRPDWVPYRTSYYREDWGFCLSHRERLALEEGEYEVTIDSTLSEGSLSYGELLLPGASREEVLLSCHVCHPSLANDNLSSVAVFTRLAQELARRGRRLSYRFLFAPGTIGAIAWLARTPEAVARVRHGLVGACLGDPGRFHYKKSRRGDAAIDRAAIHVLKTSGEDFELLDFVPFGYDERQYNSPGFNLPVGSLTRTPHGRYPEYHTSADNLDFVTPEALGGSLERYLEVIDVLEGDLSYRNLNPHGEPQLGRRGLYRSLGGGEDGREVELALLWVLNLSDGEHSLLDIAERSGMKFPLIRRAADALLAAGLLAPLTN